MSEQKPAKQTPSPELQRVIERRLAEYAAVDPVAQRDELVETWRKFHPEAAAESSQALKPLLKMEKYVKQDASDPDEIWFNDVYNVTLRRLKEDPVCGTRAGIIQIGICALDGTARHDWRDFQAIKNQLAGEEVEAFELYPAESRLLDPSNYYTLWCFPGLRRLRVGQPFRRVFDATVALAPQRAFPEGGIK